MSPASCSSSQIGYCVTKYGIWSLAHGLRNNRISYSVNGGGWSGPANNCNTEILQDASFPPFLFSDQEIADNFHCKKTGEQEVRVSAVFPSRSYSYSFLRSPENVRSIVCSFSFYMLTIGREPEIVSNKLRIPAQRLFINSVYPQGVISESWRRQLVGRRVSRSWFI